MAPLTHRDCSALLEFLEGSYSLLNLDTFMAHILSDLPKLVPAEATIYNEYSFKRNRIVWQQEPANFAFQGSERIWERYAHEHPILTHFERTKNGEAVKFSDFVSQRQFRRTSLYNEFFRSLRISHQMTFCLQEPTGLVVCIALNRTTTDFSERDRALLNLLRPHLIQAYHNAEVVMRLSVELVQARDALEKLGPGVVFLSSGGKVRTMTEQAREWLEAYFQTEMLSRNCLPETLDRWVRQQKGLVHARDTAPPPRQPLVVARAEKHLLVRLVSEPDQSLLVLEERCTTFDPAVLECLGLSRREAEVLCWIMQGKTNSVIGTILGITERTVEKHMERIFHKLSVETRTAAATLALETIQGLSRGASALSHVALPAASCV